MKIYNKVFTVLIFAVFFASFSFGQNFVGDIKIGDESQVHVIVLKNGGKLEGRIISIVDTELTFFVEESQTTSSYHLSDLIKVMVKDAVDEIEVNPDLIIRGLNRLFYMETGYGLRPGEVEYSTTWGIIHRLDYGLADGFTIGTGVVYPGYLMFHTKFNMVNSKVSKRFRMGLNLDLAARPLIVFDDFLEKDVTRWRGFMRFGLITSYGRPDRNIHIGFNVTPIFEPQDFLDSGVVSFNFGGTIKVAPHWRIIYENVFGVLESNGGFATTTGLFTGLGVCWFDKRNMIKFAIAPNQFFGFFNFPLSDTSTMHQLPVLSYSRHL